MSEKQDRSARIHPRTSQDRQDAGAAPKQLSQGIYSFEKERANFPGRDSGGRCRDHGLQVDIAGYETWPPQRLRGPRSHADAMLLLWDTHDLSRIASRRQTDPAPGAVHTIPGDALQSDKVREDRGRRRSRPRTLGDATANRGERPQLGPWTGGRWWRSWGSSSEVRRFLGNAVPVPCELGF